MYGNALFFTIIHKIFRPFISLAYLIVLDILDIAWSPDDRYLASGSVDNTVIIWNAEKFPGRLPLF